MAVKASVCWSKNTAFLNPKLQKRLSETNSNSIFAKKLIIGKAWHWKAGLMQMTTIFEKKISGWGGGRLSLIRFNKIYSEINNTQSIFKD